MDPPKFRRPPAKQICMLDAGGPRLTLHGCPELGFFRAVNLSHSPQTIHLERLALVLVCLADHQITRDPGVFRPLELSKITT